MATLIERLRERHVFNESEFYGAAPFLWRRSTAPRDVTPAAWCVAKRDVDLSVHDGAGGKGVWYQHGDKWFSYVGAIRSASAAAALAEATAWASARFGVKAWLRDPFGSYGPADYVERRINELAPGARWKRVQP